MAERKYFTIITDKGQIKIANAVASGQKLNITSFVVGDGNGTYYTPTSDMTAIKNEVWRGTISKTEILQDAQKLLRITTVIPAEVSGFVVREIGLIDEAGELIAIGNTPDMPKVALQDGASTELKLVMRLAVKNTEVFSFTIDPHTVIMTKDMLDIHDVDENAHQELFEEKADKTTMTTELGKKADKTAMETELNKKANISHTHNYAGSSSVGGPATSATKLATARTIRTNLGSTGTASFDGTANITPGVTGTLPVAKGGTGATSASTALSNLGGFPNTGGTIDGDVRINGNVTEGYGCIAMSRYGAHASGLYTVALNRGAISYIESVSEKIIKIKVSNDYEHYAYAESAFNQLAINQEIYVINAKYNNESCEKYIITSINKTDKTITVDRDLPISDFTPTVVINLNSSGNNCKTSYSEGCCSVSTGCNSHAEGFLTKASADNSHAEGYKTIAASSYSHAEGFSTKAYGVGAHAEGYNTRAGHLVREINTQGAHAEGTNTMALGWSAHAEGTDTIASGDFSHAGGYGTEAIGASQTVIGTYNKESTAETDKFIIGNGTSDTARSNCLRVTNTNGVYSNSTYKSSGADYAELFQWLDDNPEKEDRVGLFVTLVGERIRIAKPTDKRILGIVSGCPSILGDVYDDQWKGMYQTDIYGRPILEKIEVPAETIEIPDPENPEQTITKVIQETHTEIRQKLSPDFDNTQEYIPRSERPEWDAVGMMGKLVAIDDGTCEADGYCTVGENGIAKKSEQETKFYVMARVDKNHIKVMIW